MSEELEWELFDIFEFALFHFPVYEHNTARKIVRYLLYRGVIAEEIADAIEDSTVDLHLWLNRQGKNMVGEWVIAWINEAREEYLAEKAERGEEDSIAYRRTVSRERTPFSDWENSDGDGEAAADEGTISQRHKHRDRSSHDQSLIPPDDGSSDGIDIDTDIDLDETEVKRRITPSPPPLPPRSLTLRRGVRDVSQLKNIDSSPDSSDLDELDLSPKEVIHMTFTRESDFYERTPDSGAVSDIYSSIPPDNRLSRMDSADLKDHAVDDVDTSSLSTIIHQNTNTQTDNSNFTFDTSLIMANHVPHTTHCPTHGTQRITTVRGVTICPNCTCTLAHYAYLNKPIMSVCTIETADTLPLTESQDSLMQLTPPQQPTCKVHSKEDRNCELYLNTSESLPVRAMDVNIDTLDRDGPGYIFIMTDSLENCLPWSSEHRYKVASSRQPERYLTEFRSRNVDVELIWQVRVQHHLKAVREVHTVLDQYNLHSNWFKCSLSVIMDTISKTIRKYKSA